MNNPFWRTFDKTLKLAKDTVRICKLSHIDLYQSTSDPEKWMYGDFSSIVNKPNIGFIYNRTKITIHPFFWV